MEAQRRLRFKEKPNRKVSDLLWVKKTIDMRQGERPRLTAAQAKGRAYERKVAGLVAELATELQSVRETLHNPWFKFRDRFGTAHAQPDYLLLADGIVYIFEVKLTQRAQAIAQLQDLYGPLVSLYFKRPVALIAVYKNFRHMQGVTLIKSLNEARANGRVYTIHWLG